MKIEPNIYITYEMVFGDEPLPISNYLKELDKDWLIRFALFIIYSGSKFKNLNNYVTAFFCEQNHDFVKWVLDIMGSHYAKSSNDPTNIIPRTYFILSESTGLELLRQIFSISNFANTLPQTIQEQYLFKAILSINSNISKINVLEEFDENKNFTDLYYAKSLVCNFINSHERLNLKSEFSSVLQIIKGYYFFKFCENSRLQPHLAQFLKNNGFQSWTQYLYNAIHLILYPLQNGNEEFPVIKLNEKLEGYKYLHAHSFGANSIITLNENCDYTFFKTYPLIEVDKQTFLPINAIFCINHLYRSVYFEFSKINNSFDESLKIKGFPTYITTEFSEKYLFYTFIKNTLCKQRGIKLTGDDCKKLFPGKDREPDFYHRDGNNIFLFENKDIKINKDVINSKNYGKIGDELSKKLIKKVGVDQLVEHIKAIDAKKFIWDNNLPKHPRIYPILVLDDRLLCVPGLNYILNDALQNQLENCNVQIKIHPLVVIELDTLISYATYFKTGRIHLKKLIEDYYSYLQRCRKKVTPEEILYEVYHKFLPFYTYVSQEGIKEPFDDTLFNQICNELRSEEKTINCT